MHLNHIVLVFAAKRRWTGNHNFFLVFASFANPNQTTNTLWITPFHLQCAHHTHTTVLLQCIVPLGYRMRSANSKQTKWNEIHCVHSNARNETKWILCALCSVHTHPLSQLPATLLFYPFPCSQKQFYYNFVIFSNYVKNIKHGKYNPELILKRTRFSFLFCSLFSLTFCNHHHY